MVPADLTSRRGHLSEELPFAPGGEPGMATTNPKTSLSESVAAFRWRRPLLMVLAVAASASVALASQQTRNLNSEGRTSGAMSDSGSGRTSPGSGIGDAEVVSQAAVDGAWSETYPEESGTAADRARSSDRDIAPLHVTAPPSMPAVAHPDAGGGIPTAGSNGEGSNGAEVPTTAAVGTSLAGASSSVPFDAEGADSLQPSTAARSSTTSPAATSTESTVVVKQAIAAPTTAHRATTTASSSTTRTPTTVVLVGNTDGDFESPSIDQDMVWLENGDVGRWRSTNGDIQLMRSGFEGIDSLDGGQYAELNSSSQGGLYLTLSVAPGTTLAWEFLHRARNKSEKIEVRIGAPSSEDLVDTVKAEQTWMSHNGRWRVPDGMTSVRFVLWSTETGPYGNLVDAVRVTAAEG